MNNIPKKYKKPRKVINNNTYYRRLISVEWNEYFDKILLHSIQKITNAYDKQWYSCFQVVQTIRFC